MCFNHSMDSGDYDQVHMYNSKLIRAMGAPPYPQASSLCSFSVALQQCHLLTARVVSNITIIRMILTRYSSDPQSDEIAARLLRSLFSEVDELDSLFEKKAHQLAPCTASFLTVVISSLLTDL